MFDFDHVSCFMFLGINKICKIPRSKFLVNIATFCFEKCPLNVKTEFYSICYNTHIITKSSQVGLTEYVLKENSSTRVVANAQCG